MLCVNGEWQALCSTTWSSTQAQVVCRQLGKNTNGKILINIDMCSNVIVGAMPVNVSVATGTMSVLRANFDCLGNEKFLYNCSDHDSISCDNITSQTTVVAGAICEGKI